MAPKQAKCSTCGQTVDSSLHSELKKDNSKLDELAHYIVNEVLDELNKSVDTDLFDEIKARVWLALAPEEGGRWQ